MFVQVHGNTIQLISAVGNLFPIPNRQFEGCIRMYIIIRYGPPNAVNVAFVGGLPVRCAAFFHLCFVCENRFWNEIETNRYSRHSSVSSTLCLFYTTPPTIQPASQPFAIGPCSAVTCFCFTVGELLIGAFWHRLQGDSCGYREKHCRLFIQFDDAMKVVSQGKLQCITDVVVASERGVLSY